MLTPEQSATYKFPAWEINHDDPRILSVETLEISTLWVFPHCVSDIPNQALAHILAALVILPSIMASVTALLRVIRAPD